jgi:WD40 repeat-containing protein SMU1|tara:strand:- start:6533 stop:8197 length:1665 start_codon:yes stop_codon:yes gene_type:complete|mmetsp:Transcript_5217/g.23118  ORF Transcript_5217/g.23118 Transcript_5217/m.23118 type:complete len:555 (+) Transcript_5217:195-1859(+)
MGSFPKHSTGDDTGIGVALDAGDVTRWILQFFQENHLPRSYSALEGESQVSFTSLFFVCGLQPYSPIDIWLCLTLINQASLNAPGRKTKILLDDVMNGRWDVVLPEIARLKIPEHKLQDLYADVITDLIELHELDTAKTLLYKSDTMSRLRLENHQRVSSLERLICGHTITGIHGEALPIPEDDRGKRRASIARGMSSEMENCSPSQMLAMLGHSITLHQSPGFPSMTVSTKSSPKILGRQSAEDLCPCVEHRVIDFGKKSSPRCLCFSPDGFLIAVGFADGFIEMWDWDAGIIRSVDGAMVHDAGVLALDFSQKGDMLASACQRGNIKVWKVHKGQILRNFERAHPQEITSISFSPDSSYILSASVDGTSRIHGLKSGRMIKELRGHSGIINTAFFLADGTKVLSASSDGTVRLWNAKSSDTISKFTPAHSDPTSPSKTIVRSALPLKDSQHCLVCTSSGNVNLMTLTGTLVRTYSAGDQGTNFIACAPSSQARLVHALAEEGHIFSFDTNSGNLENILQIQDLKLVDFCIHPLLNILAAISSASVRVWRPSL